MAERPEHWTEDEELVERFVRGEVAPHDLTDLRRHLETCESCRRRVEVERALRSAVIAEGRAGLRSRLRVQLAARRTTADRYWPWVATAAVLLVVFGLWNFPAKPTGGEQQGPTEVPPAAPPAESPTVELVPVKPREAQAERGTSERSADRLASVQRRADRATDALAGAGAVSAAAATR